MRETLLDFDRLPTLEELREFFKANDFSTAFDSSKFENFSEDETLVFNYTKKLIDEKWESLSAEMGLKSHSKYYGEDNPLIILRDNIQNVVANEVLKLTDENFDSTELEQLILETFDYDFEDTEISADNEKAIDDMLHNAVKTFMDTMQYEEIEKWLEKIFLMKMSTTEYIITIAHKILIENGIILEQKFQLFLLKTLMKTKKLQLTKTWRLKLKRKLFKKNFSV